MEVRTLARPLSLLSAMVSLFFAPSHAASSNPTPIGTATVCATGTCCRQTSSICNAGGADQLDRYYAATGNCGGS